MSQSLRFASRFQPSSQGVQRAIQSFLVKLWSQWRLASTTSERYRDQPFAKHIFSSELGDRLLAADRRFHQPPLRQRPAQTPPCFPQLIA